MRIIRPLDGSNLLVDGLEPKNGDFASYVEELTRLPISPPAAHQFPTDQPTRPSDETGWGHAPAQRLSQGSHQNPTMLEDRSAPRREAAPSDMPSPGTSISQSPAPSASRSLPKDLQGMGSQGTRSRGEPFDLERWIVSKVKRITRFGRELSAALILAGIVLIAAAISNQKWLPVDPAPGFVMIAVGVILRRIASRMS